MPFDPAHTFARHPFFRDHAVIFESAPMQRGYAQLRFPMMLGLGGAFSARPPGTGKTALHHYCARAFRKHYPGLPVIEVAAHRLAPTATRSFPHRLCVAAGEVKPPRGGQELRGRLESVFLQLARGSEYKRVVLLIDEGQDLGASGFYVLKDLFNQMSYEGLGLSVFLSGVANKLYRLLQQLETDDESGLIRRFASFEIHGTAYQSVEDVASLCRAIDETTIDELNGLTTVQSIWPRAASNNFRWVDYAEWLYSVHGKQEVSASEIFSLLRMLFLSHEDSPDLKLQQEQIATAAEQLRSASRFGAS